MSHGSWEEIKAQRADDPEAQAGYAQARRAYEVGREVRRLREEAGLTQRQLADRAGMTQSVIARLEAGGTEPTLATLDRVAKALGLELTIAFQRVA
jgi:ribosome-binding protein aMBF1 (putative translation factor)